MYLVVSLIHITDWIFGSSNTQDFRLQHDTNMDFQQHLEVRQKELTDSGAKQFEGQRS